MPLVVHHADPVSVPVNSDADIRAMRQSRFTDAFQKGDIFRVGVMVREFPVGFAVKLDESQPRALSTAGAKRPAVPLPAANTTFNGRESGPPVRISFI